MEENNQLQPDDVPDSQLVTDEIPLEVEVFSPIEQHTIIFYGKPIVVVRLPDGRPAVVMRYLCDNMQLDRSGQIRRIQRTKAITEDLINVLVQTRSGVQKMPALILRSLPYWLLGIDPGRARLEMQEEILRYQKEAVDILYAWAQAPRAIERSAQPVPMEVPIKPLVEPGPDATHSEWASYHEAMALWHRWKADQHMHHWRAEIEKWRGSVEARLEGDKAMTDLIPEILERLGPQTLTPQHHRQVQVLARQLHQATGKPFPTIYDDLKTAFEKPRIEDLLEEDWPQIHNWFTLQIERARKK